MILKQICGKTIYKGNFNPIIHIINEVLILKSNL